MSELRNRAIEMEIAEKVMGLVMDWREGQMVVASSKEQLNAGRYAPLPDYTDSLERTFKVEDRIADLNLKGTYASALHRIVAADMKDGDIESGQWLLAHASPEQRCRAALECVKEKAKAASG